MQTANKEITWFLFYFLGLIFIFIIITLFLEL